MLLLQLIINFSFLSHLLNSFVISAPPRRACTDNWMSTPGYTTPRGDIILKVGSPLEIYCTLNTSSSLAEGYTADDIVFDKGAVTIDKKYVTVVNRTTARLYMENVPITEEVRFHYCYVTRPNSSNISSLALYLSPAPAKRIVCMNYVEVGVSPQNVSNFNCVSRNWESLNCTWKEPNNGVLAVYSLFYSIPGGTSPTKWYKCPQNEKNTCEWSLNTLPAYIRDVEFINFRMDAHNRLGNISRTFEFYHYAHVIPAPARELSFLATTSHSIYIEWNIGIFKNFKKGLAYRVSYAWYLANDWNDEEGKFNSEDAVKSQTPCRNSSIESCWNVLHYSADDVEIYDEDIVGVNVTNLKYPNIVYDFRIEMKSAVAGDDLWSDPASLFARTDPCAPYYSPEINSGGFQILNQHLNRRDVVLFWKEIPPEEQNGPEFQYDIIVYEDEIESTTKPNLVTGSYAKYANLSPSKNYRFVVKSANYFGPAPYSAELRVPKKDDILPEVVSFNKISHGDGTYELSWLLHYSIGDKITNFTIFWCRSNREYPAPCSGPLNWTHIPANTSRQNFTLEPNLGHQFAISANSHNSTSGMVWASCTILRNRLQKMRNIWVSAVGSNFIDLSWKLECSERAADVKGYNITYCLVDKIDLEQCDRPEETLLVYGDTKTSHANITDLHPFAHYKMAVSIFTDKLLGPPSDNLCNRTAEAAPNMADVEIQILNITHSSVILKWNPPAILNGLLNRYEVLYNNEKLITNKTTVTLTGLRSYESYRVRINACTIYCSRSDSLHFRTSIGSPEEVTKIWIESKMNSTHTKLSWDPPAKPAGPSPTYDVSILVIQPDKNSTIGEFETSATEAVVKIYCEQESSHLSYTFFVRAKNLDNSNTTEFRQNLGPWSAGYSIDCINQGVSVMWKIVIGLFFCLLLLLMFAYLSVKSYRKYHEMNDGIEVALPKAFIIGVQIQVERSGCKVDEKLETYDDEIDDPGTEDENDRLNIDDHQIDHPNVDEEDPDQRYIDSVELNVHANKEKAR